MRFRWYYSILLMVLLVSAVSAQAGISTALSTAASQVSVTNVVLDPTILMPHDEGLVTIEVTNSGTESVPLSVAYLFSDGVTALNNGDYLSLGTLGGGNKMTFTFTLTANVKDGVYYPLFSLGFREPSSDSLRFPIPVKVESSDLQLSVIAAPDTFSPGRTDAIFLSVGNPRENMLNGIVIVPEGEGFTFAQKSYFVGDLTPGKAVTVIFNVTPTIATDLTFTAQYRNGMNDHTTTVAVPVTFGTDKTRADPVVNNIQLTLSGSVYTLTGDVTNAGLTDARGVVVTVDSPAQGVDPNPLSPLGSLAPDDLSSFEITFTAPNLTEVPLLIVYKDLDGNEFRKNILVGLNFGGLNSAPVAGAGGPPILPILIVIVVVIAIIIAWNWGLFRRKSRK